MKVTPDPSPIGLNPSHRKSDPLVKHANACGFLLKPFTETAPEGRGSEDFFVLKRLLLGPVVVRLIQRRSTNAEAWPHDASFVIKTGQRIGFITVILGGRYNFGGWF